MIKFGSYLLTSGWGGQGIYDDSEVKRVVFDDPDDPKKGRDVIDESAVICGTGSGYEEFDFDEEMCIKIVEVYNKSLEQKGK